MYNKISKLCIENSFSLFHFFKNVKVIDSVIQIINDIKELKILINKQHIKLR